MSLRGGLVVEKAVFVRHIETKPNEASPWRRGDTISTYLKDWN